MQIDNQNFIFKNPISKGHIDQLITDNKNEKIGKLVSITPDYEKYNKLNPMSENKNSYLV